MCPCVHHQQCFVRLERGKNDSRCTKCCSSVLAAPYSVNEVMQWAGVQVLRNAGHLSVTPVHDGTKESTLGQSPRTSVSSSVKNRIHACLVGCRENWQQCVRRAWCRGVLPADPYCVSFFSVYLPPPLNCELSEAKYIYLYLCSWV